MTQTAPGEERSIDAIGLNRSRHCELRSDEAIHAAQAAYADGLLRFTRNDRQISHLVPIPTDRTRPNRRLRFAAPPS